MEAGKNQKPQTSVSKSDGKRHRVTLILTLCFLAIALVCCAGYRYYSSKISLLQYSDGKAAPGGSIDDEEAHEANEAMKQVTADLEEREAVAAEGDVASDSDVVNILLIGTDEYTSYFSENARGDSCMLFSLNKKTMKVNLVSFERGTGVPILAGEYEGQWDWLTHTFRYGGADLMMQEIRECYKVDVSKYVRVNLHTFVQLIDSVGGVDVTLTQAEADYINKRTGSIGVQQVAAGDNHLNGATAIAYARCRAIDDDWHRIERQRNVIQSVLESAKSMDLLELNALLDDVLPLVQTNLAESDITSLLLLAPGAGRITVEQMTIPVAGSYGSMTGMEGRSLFAVDFAQNAEILREQLYGEAE